MNETKLTKLLKEAAAAHHLYEETLGAPDSSWPEWYAGYIMKHWADESCMGAAVDAIINSQEDSDAMKRFFADFY